MFLVCKGEDMNDVDHKLGFDYWNNKYHKYF